MNIFDKFFKKEEKNNNDILAEIRRNLAQTAFFELNVLRSSAEDEAKNIIVWCKVAEKKNDPSDHVDVAMMLMSYSAASSFAIMQKMKDLLKSQANGLETNVCEVLGKIDILYDENDQIKSLKSKRAEAYYLFGKKPTFRIKKAAQILAVCILMSENLQAARAFYQNGQFSKEVRKRLEDEIRTYDENIVKEIIS